MICPNCGKEHAEDIALCDSCGYHLSMPVGAEMQAEEGPMEETSVKKSKKGLIIGIIAGVVVVAAAVLIYLFYIGFGAYTGPLADAKRGVVNLLDEGNFTMTVTVGDNTSTLAVDFDEDSGKLKFAYHDGSTSTAMDGERSYTVTDWYCSESEWEVDGDDMIMLVELARDLVKNSSVEWDTVFSDVDDMGMDLEEFIDTEAIEALVDDLHDQLNDEEWLEKNFGFSEEGDELRFEFDMYSAAKAVVDVVKEHIDDDYADMIDSALSSEKSDLKDMEIEAVITVDGGDLVGLKVCVNDGDEVNIKFSKIGETKVDSEIKAVLERYDAFGCAECGSRDYLYDGGLCYNCWYYDPCAECGIETARDSMYDGGLCYDCYYYDTCAECGEYEYMYDGGLCSDCYYYDPCAECGDEVYVDSMYDGGLCYDCWYYVPCAECGKETSRYDLYDGDVCYDCYYYGDCTDCGEYAYLYDGDLCYDCYRYDNCAECGDSVDISEMYGNLCYTCYYYDNCAECGETVFDLYDGGLCYDCYYYDYCDECGSYEYLYDGSQCYDCYYYERCSECGDTAYSLYTGDLCYDCYYYDPCAECGDSVYTLYDGDLCYECYYYDYCSTCGTYGYLQDGSQCWDCYWDW